MNTIALAIGEMLFRHAYPLYRPLYSLYKAILDGEERRFAASAVRAPATIVDVGANIGVYARFFAGLAGRQGHVYAFEPSPQNYAHLRANILDLKNVTPVHAAVGKRSGSTKLFVSDYLNVDHQIYDDGAGRCGIDVPLVRLDDYLVPGTQVDFIKIDVQGAELDVLQGATRVLADNPGVKLLVEYWPFGLAQAGVEPAALLDLIRVAGFEYRVIGRAADQSRDLRSVDTSIEGQYWNLAVGRFS